MCECCCDSLHYTGSQDRSLHCSGPYPLHSLTNAPLTHTHQSLLPELHTICTSERRIHMYYWPRLSGTRTCLSTNLMTLNSSREENCSLRAFEATSSNCWSRAGSGTQLSITRTARQPVTTPNERRLRRTKQMWAYVQSPTLITS